MTHRSFIRLCSVFIVACFALTLLALGAAVVTFKRAASRGDLPVLTWGPAR